MYLLLSICASTLIFVIFKVVGKRNINTLQTIVINYFTAFTYGILSYDAPIIVSDIIQSKWFFGAIGLGFLFIAIFNVMALTAQRNGLSVASVASKMSVVIKRQSVMPNILSTVNSFTHTSNSQGIDQVLFLLSLYVLE